MMKRWIPLAMCALALGCGGDESAPAGAGEAPQAEAPAPNTPATPPKTFDAATLKADAETIALVPSPAEMEKALSTAGIDAKLGDMIADRDISMDVENKDQIANVAAISSADEEIGKTIADAIDKVGKDGVITVEEGQTFGLELDFVELEGEGHGFRQPENRRLEYELVGRFLAETLRRADSDRSGGQ